MHRNEKSVLIFAVQKFKKRHKLAINNISSSAYFRILEWRGKQRKNFL